MCTVLNDKWTFHIVYLSVARNFYSAMSILIYYYFGIFDIPLMKLVISWLSLHGI